MIVPVNTADMIEAGLPIIGGLAVTLYAFGLGATPEMERWRAKHGRTMKIVGPLVVVGGVLRALNVL